MERIVKSLVFDDPIRLNNSDIVRINLFSPPGLDSSADIVLSMSMHLLVLMTSVLYFGSIVFRN